MQRATRALLLAFLAIVGMPGQSWARGYLNPWTGIIFGNPQATNQFRSFGASFGEMKRIFGTETNVGYTPGFFGTGVKNYVLDLNAGILAGPDLGIASRLHPYGAIGLSSIRASIRSNGVSPGMTRMDIGFNAGGGVVVDLKSEDLSVRVDGRFYRSFNGASSPNNLDVDLSHFHFWRLGIGLVIR
jgi:opacity protein-like surface antigen